MVVGSLGDWLEDTQGSTGNGRETRQEARAAQRQHGVSRSPFPSCGAPGDSRHAPTEGQGGGVLDSARVQSQEGINMATVGHVEPHGTGHAAPFKTCASSTEPGSAARQRLSPRRHYSLLSRQLSQSAGSPETGPSFGRDIEGVLPLQPAMSAPFPERTDMDFRGSLSRNGGSNGGSSASTINSAASAASPAQHISAGLSATAVSRPLAASTSPNMQQPTSQESHGREVQAAAARACAARAATIAPLAAVCSSSLIAAAAGYVGGGAGTDSGVGSSSSGGGGPLQCDDSTGGSRRGGGGSGGDAAGGSLHAASSGSADSSEGADLCGGLAAAMLMSDESLRGRGARQSRGAAAFAAAAAAIAAVASESGIACGSALHGRGRWATGRGGGAGGRAYPQHPSCSSLPEMPQRQGATSSSTLSGPLSASPRAPNSSQCSLSRTYGPAALPATTAADSLIAAAASAAAAATLSLPGLPSRLHGLSPAGPEGGTAVAGPCAALLAVGASELLPCQPRQPQQPQQQLRGSQLPVANVDRGLGATAPGGAAAAAAAGEEDFTLSVFPTRAAPVAVAPAPAPAPPVRVPAVPAAAASGAAGSSNLPPHFLSWPFGAATSAFAAAMATGGPESGSGSGGSSRDSSGGGGGSGGLLGDGNVWVCRGGNAEAQPHVASVSSYPPGGYGGAAAYEGTMRGGARRGARPLSRLDSAPAGSLLARIRSDGGSLPDGR